MPNPYGTQINGAPMSMFSGGMYNPPAYQNPSATAGYGVSGNGPAIAPGQMNYWQGLNPSQQGAWQAWNAQHAGQTMPNAPQGRFGAPQPAIQGNTNRMPGFKPMIPGIVGGPPSNIGGAKPMMPQQGGGMNFMPRPNYGAAYGRGPMPAMRR